jgi:hypothetical protein
VVVVEDLIQLGILAVVLEKLVLQVQGDEQLLGKDLLVKVVVDEDLIQLGIIAVVLDKLVLHVQVDVQVLGNHGVVQAYEVECLTWLSVRP